MNTQRCRQPPNDTYPRICGQIPLLVVGPARLATEATDVLAGFGSVVGDAGTGPELLAATADGTNGPGQKFFELGELGVDVDVALASHSIGLGMRSVDDPGRLGVRRLHDFRLRDEASLLFDTIGHRAVVRRLTGLDHPIGFAPCTRCQCVVLLLPRLDRSFRRVRGVVDELLGMGLGLRDHPVRLGLGVGENAVRGVPGVLDGVLRLGVGGRDRLLGGSPRVADELVTVIEHVLCIVQFPGDRIPHVVQKFQHVTSRHDATRSHRDTARLLDNGNELVESLEYAVHR